MSYVLLARRKIKRKEENSVQKSICRYADCLNHGGSIASSEELAIDPQVDAVMRSSRTFEDKIKELEKMDKADAAFVLGVIYQTGMGGVAKDEAASARWHKKAAERGNVESQYMIGTYYQGGTGLPMDLKKAAYWYGKAADNGLAEAAEALEEVEGSMWLSKTGWVSIDDVCQSGAMDCSGPIMVTSNTYINHWAGEVIEAYYVKGNGTFSRYKISISWITDRSSYRCGQIIVKGVDEVKDFTSRSFAMKRCD